MIIEIARYSKKEHSWHDAIVNACCRRTRAIVLTSLTTVLGLLPLLFSNSFAVMFLKPMVISILFGMLFSSIIVMILIPSVMASIPRKWMNNVI